MNIWNVLEIEKTKDKDSIQNAYRRKVVTVNPEEDQRGSWNFERLMKRL